MKLCRVVGTVVATVKHPTLVGTKLLAVEPVDEDRRPAGSSYLAVDRVQAGVGDLVLVNSEGGGARQLVGLSQSPMRSLIVGIVDRVDCDVEALAVAAPAVEAGGEA